MINETERGELAAVMGEMMWRKTSDDLKQRCQFHLYINLDIDRTIETTFTGLIQLLYRFQVSMVFMNALLYGLEYSDDSYGDEGEQQEDIGEYLRVIIQVFSIFVLCSVGVVDVWVRHLKAEDAREDGKVAKVAEGELVVSCISIDTSRECIDAEGDVWGAASPLLIIIVVIIVVSYPAVVVEGVEAVTLRAWGNGLRG